MRVCAVANRSCITVLTSCLMSDAHFQSWPVVLVVVHSFVGCRSSRVYVSKALTAQNKLCRRKVSFRSRDGCECVSTTGTWGIAQTWKRSLPGGWQRLSHFRLHLCYQRCTALSLSFIANFPANTSPSPSTANACKSPTLSNACPFVCS